MRRALPIAWLCLCIAAFALAKPTPPPATETIAEIGRRFDHALHDRPLQKEGLGCTACHQVGGRGDARIAADRLDAAFLAPPGSSCHFCHNPPEGRREIGPGRCALCHRDVPPPDNHGAGWVALHGSEVHVGALECEDCHRPAFCIDCHTRRQRVDFRVHDRTWIAVHGVASFADPTECSTCHLQADCIRCHTSPSGSLP